MNGKKYKNSERHTHTHKTEIKYKIHCVRAQGDARCIVPTTISDIKFSNRQRRRKKREKVLERKMACVPLCCMGPLIRGDLSDCRCITGGLHSPIDTTRIFREHHRWLLSISDLPRRLKLGQFARIQNTMYTSLEKQKICSFVPLYRLTLKSPLAL